MFPRLEILHLPHTKSNHSPILLDTDPPIHRLSKPFKFEQMWPINQSFSTLVENSWHSSTSLPSSSSSSSSLSRFQHHLKYLTSNIIDWNNNHFGILFWKKHYLLARLRGIQLALSCKPSTFLYLLVW